MKKLKKYSNGGAILQSVAPLANLIPGVGQIISPLLSVAGGLMSQDVKPPVQTVKTSYTNNPYQMRQGGTVSGFKQYDTESHENGGQPINAEGNVDFKNPTAEIESTETNYKYSKLPNKYGKTYVFSDKNGTSEMTRDIMKKYKNKNVDGDFLARTAMELEFNKVENLNELIKAKEEQTQENQQMASGGNISTRRLEGQHQDNTNVFDKVLKASQDNLEQLADGDLLGTPITLGTHVGENNYFNPNQTPWINNPVTDSLEQISKPVVSQNSGLPQIPNARTAPNYLEGIKAALGSLNVPSPNINNGNISNAITTGLAAFDVTRALTEKPDSVNPRMTDYNKSDEKMYSTNTDLTGMKNAAQNATNQAVSQVNDGSLSQSQRQSRLQGVYSNLGNTFSNIALQEQQQRNQLLTQQSQYEMSKAQDNSNHLIASDEKYAMNKAVTNQLKDVARQTLNSFAKDQSEKQFAKDQLNNALTQARLKTADGFALLNKMVSNFGMDGAAEWQKYLSNPSPENEKALHDAIKIKMKI